MTYAIKSELENTDFEILLHGPRQVHGYILGNSEWFPAKSKSQGY